MKKKNRWPRQQTSDYSKHLVHLTQVLKYCVLKTIFHMTHDNSLSILHVLPIAGLKMLCCGAISRIFDLLEIYDLSYILKAGICPNLRTEMDPSSIRVHAACWCYMILFLVVLVWLVVGV